MAAPDVFTNPYAQAFIVVFVLQGILSFALPYGLGPRGARGAIVVNNVGPVLGGLFGSAFFLTTKATPGPGWTVFGRIVGGVWALLTAAGVYQYTTDPKSLLKK